jgi:hypothetical protein
MAGSYPCPQIINTLAYYTKEFSTVVKSFMIQAPEANPIKLFTTVIYRFSLKARVFVPGKPFHPSLMFVGTDRSLPQSGSH